jgi:hypothetical protein
MAAFAGAWAPCPEPEQNPIVIGRHVTTGRHTRPMTWTVVRFYDLPPRWRNASAMSIENSAKPRFSALRQPAPTNILSWACRNRLRQGNFHRCNRALPAAERHWR